jgi:hypothetical protein
MSGTEYRNRALMVIAAADQLTANTAALQFDPDGGAQTFTVALSPTGEEPATHYLASVAVTDEQWQQLLAMRAGLFPSAVIVEWYEQAEPARANRLLEELGLRRIQAATIGGEDSKI